MNFKELVAQRPDKEIFKLYVNGNYVNYIVQSKQTQVGECIIHLAVPAGESDGKASCPVMSDLAALQAMFPHLITVQLYDTALQKTGAAALLNLERVRTIIPKGTFVDVIFVDGVHLQIDGMPINA